MPTEKTSEFGLKLTRPKGWKDQTMYVFAAPKAHAETGFEANVTIIQTQLPLTTSFEAYVKQEYERYKTDMEDFTLIHQRKGQVQTHTAQEILFTWMVEDLAIMQRVVFLKAGLKRVITFSALAAKDEYPEQAQIFNQILASLDG